MQEDIKPIDLKHVFYIKNPKLSKKIPDFAYKLLAKIVHLKQINEFIVKYGKLRNIESTHAIIKFLNLTINTRGLETIPDNGRYIFASNHPLGGPDGVILLNIIGSKYNEVRFPVNDILLNLKIIENIFIPINKHGALGRKAAKDLTEAYHSNAQIIMFPAGLVSRKHKGIIKDLVWQKSFISKAIESKRDIIPIHVNSRNTNLFYNMANLRKKLGIKNNYEMLLLPHEAFKKQNSTIEVKFGKPIKWETLTASNKDFYELAQYVKEEVYKLDK